MNKFPQLTIFVGSKVRQIGLKTRNAEQILKRKTTDKNKKQTRVESLVNHAGRIDLKCVHTMQTSQRRMQKYALKQKLVAFTQAKPSPDQRHCFHGTACQIIFTHATSENFQRKVSLPAEHFKAANLMACFFVTLDWR